MEERWALIEEFPNYIVSNYGDVVNEGTGRQLRPSLTKQGAVKVGLVKGGIQHARSVKVLVANYFVEGENDIFNTPIQLDNDPFNNRADNLIWRPRSFALRYARQFTNCERFKLGFTAPFEDIETGERYESIYEAGVKLGLLFRQIEICLYRGEPCFPDWKTFEWTK